MPSIEDLLRFYFITDDGPAGVPITEQVEIALAAGATLIQYRNKRFSLKAFDEVQAVRSTCGQAGVPLIVNDHVLLAKAVAADGVHVGQEDEAPRLARAVMGPSALVGLSISSLDELRASYLDGCDYIGCGPVFATATKPDAKPEGGLELLRAVVRESILPVVAIGGIDASNAGRCFEHGAVGVAVITAVSRARDPKAAAHDLARACGL
jgi:thiamine-phosphate pyrophosphorylase